MAKKAKKKEPKPKVEVKKGLHKFSAWLKTQKPKDLTDLALNMGLAYAGIVAFKPNDVKGSILSSMYGPISLRLATTPSAGLMSPSQIAGVAGLAFLGLGVLPQDVKDQVSETIKEAIKPTPFGLPAELRKQLEERRIFGVKNPFTGEIIWEWKW